MGSVLFEKEGKIAFVTLNRPEKLNAINLELAREFYETMYSIENDSELRCVVLKGEGRAFCAGGDLVSFVSSDDIKKTVSEVVMYLNEAVLSIRRMDKVVIASVHGAVSGAGVGLMAVCDLAIAAKNTKFNLAYAKIGASPDAASSIVVARTLGLKRASYYILTGDFFSADEALNMGLVNFVVDEDKLQEKTLEIAHRMCELAPLAVKYDKFLINRELFWDMETLLEAEKEGIANLSVSEDMQEGIKAFFEKRKPVFKGK